MKAKRIKRKAAVIKKDAGNVPANISAFNRAAGNSDAVSMGCMENTPLSTIEAMRILDEDTDMLTEHSEFFNFIESDVRETDKNILNEASLYTATPYMLNKKGELLDCGSVHPYIVTYRTEQEISQFSSVEKCIEEVQNIIEPSTVYNLVWYYNNTSRADVKRDIEKVVACLLGDIKSYPGIRSSAVSELRRNFNVTEEEGCKPFDIVSLLYRISDCLNNEFCRVRTSDIYLLGSNKSIYFRISSVGYNWFNLIWKVVYENRRFIESVNICSDADTFGKLKWYSHNGQVIKDMPTEEFISLSGNPVIESKSIEESIIGHPFNFHTKVKRLGNSYLSEHFVDVDDECPPPLSIREALWVLDEDYLTESKADWDKLSQHLSLYQDTGIHAIEVFKKFKDRLKAEERDIYYWLKKDPEDFIYRMSELETTKSKTQSDKEARQSGYEKVAENDKWNVYKILNHEAAMQLGKGTKWCITMNSSSYWDDYIDRGYEFYFFIRKKPQKDEYDKIALQYKDSYSVFWDSLDNNHEALIYLGVPTKFDGANISNVVLDGTYKSSGDEVNYPIREYIVNAEIQEGVTEIKENAFFKCESMESVSIPDSVSKIGEFAFYACSKLKSIALPNSLQSVGQGAFLACAVREVKIPENVVSIGKRVFHGCSGLRTIYCEVGSKPEGWDEDWLGNCSAKVVWGYKKKQESVQRKPKLTLNESADEVTDSQGNPLTDEQVNYFKDSKIRDKQGRLLVCYHGTPNPGFTEFNPKDAKSQFGNYKFDKYNVNYFTTSLDTAKGYTEIGVGNVDENIYAVYLNIKNPYIVDNSTEAEIRNWKNIKDRKIRDTEIRVFNQLIRKWQNNRHDISVYEDELNRDLHKFNKAVKPSKDGGTWDYDLVDLGSNTLFGSAHPVMYGYRTIYELFEDEDRLREELLGIYDEEDDDDYMYSIDYIINWVLYLNEAEGGGYDGIIVEDISDVGPHGSWATPNTTDIITLVSSNQIKLVRNQSPTSSNRINETSTLSTVEAMRLLEDEEEIDAKLSDEVDSEGVVLTEQQARFFKNSKIRDAQGNLIVCYHGTAAAFYEFDEMLMGGGDYGAGFYFTDGRDYAQEVASSNVEMRGEQGKGVVMECYLNITNPCIWKNKYDFDKYMDYAEKERLRLYDYMRRHYDGLIVEKPFFDDSPFKSVKFYLAFKPNQIKSVDNLNPTNSNNIMESK